MALSPFDPLALDRWDPFREMSRMRETMNQMFGGQGTGSAAPAVAVDIRETDGDYRIEASLPGVKPQDVRVSVDRNVVMIEGERKESHERREGERVTYSEHRQGHFARAFSLASPVDADKAQAEFHDGILCLTLPKSEAARPRQIPISGSQASSGESSSAQSESGGNVERQDVSAGT